MADGAVTRLDGVADDVGARVQVSVLETVLLLARDDFVGHGLGRREGRRRKHHGAPRIRAIPVCRESVVLEQRDLVLARDGTVSVDVGAPLDLLTRERHDDPPPGRIDLAHRHRRDQHLASREPSARVHDEVTHGPVHVVEVAILDFADRAVRRRQMEAREVLHADEHGRLPRVGSCKASAGGMRVAARNRYGARARSAHRSRVARHASRVPAPGAARSERRRFDVVSLARARGAHRVRSGQADPQPTSATVGNSGPSRVAKALTLSRTRPRTARTVSGGSSRSIIPTRIAPDSTWRQ